MAMIEQLRGNNYKTLEKLNESVAALKLINIQHQDTIISQKVNMVLSHNYVGIANLQIRFKEFEKARKSLNNAKSILIEYPSENTMKYLNSIYGNLELQQENYREALHYVNKSIQSTLNIRYEGYSLINYYIDKGKIYKELQQLDSARHYLTKSFDLMDTFNSKISLNFALNNLGEVYLELGDHKMAETYFLRSLELYNEGSHTNSPEKLFGGLSSVYEGLGDYRSALKYANLERISRDSIHAEQEKDLTDRIENKFEYGQRLSEKQVMLNQETLTADNARRVQLLLSIILFLVLLSLFGMTVFNRKLNTQKKALKQ